MDNATRDDDDEVEGLDESPADLEAYPLDSLLIRTEPRTIVDVLRRINKKLIKLDPDFQRDFVWEPERQSRLIESILMRIPLPVFYVAEDKQGKLIVVDGLQRLTTLKLFDEQNLTLTVKNPELNGKTKDDLPQRLRDRFEDGQLLFYIIDHKAPERVRLDVFERVNSGVALTRQQMRNALYNGEATRLLRTLAESVEFKEASGRALDKKKLKEEQRDREVINRFLMFYVLGWRNYEKSDVDEFLGESLRVVNLKTNTEREEIQQAFFLSMRRNRRIFNRYAFCKHESPTGRKGPFNVALFDVFSTLLAAYPGGRLKGYDREVQSGFFELMQDPRFMRSITGATTSAESVRGRFVAADRMLRSVLGDP